jgi:ADP-ribosylglycohydrolase
MPKKKFLSIIIGALLVMQFGFRSPVSEKEAAARLVERTTEPETYVDTSLSKEELYDKILGFLVGSAIGDAMGAPTEMWSREGIEIEYGYVDDLDKLVREASPEGPWDFNLAAGGTTDDTRWKQLAFQYLIQEDRRRNRRSPPVQDARNFARYIIDLYLADIENLKKVDSFDPEPFEVSARKMTWLQEWALVAKPYLDNDLDAYSRAVNRFYGGDLSCAGMLYTPAIGAFYPGQPEVAYEEAYKLAIFDLGYARDLSSLTAAMAAAAFAPNAQPEDILHVIRDVDPNDYFKSRLIGRTAYRLLRQARLMTYEAKKVEMDYWEEQDLRRPAGYPHDSLYFARTYKAYQLLEDQLQDVPFHAAEIFLVNLTALLFTDMDFQRSLEFITNFGRDNDTTGAVAGAILGAYHGASKLPKSLVEQVLRTNKEELNIDLEALAKTFTETLIAR